MQKKTREKKQQQQPSDLPNVDIINIHITIFQDTKKSMNAPHTHIFILCECERYNKIKYEGYAFFVSVAVPSDYLHSIHIIFYT